MTLVAAIAALQVHAKAAGAKDAPPLPAETAIGYPFSVCYPATGSISAETAGAQKDLMTVNLDLHVNRIDLPTDVQTILSFFTAFAPLLIADPTLGGAVDTIVMEQDDPIRWNFGQMQYAEIKTVGLRYAIKLKIRS